MNQSFATASLAASNTLDEQQLCDYLQQHPDFFNRHPELLEKLRIPHPSGEAVSLVERQLDRLRQQNQQLQHQLCHLMSVAANNERVYRIYRALDLRLIACDSLDEMMSILFDGMCAQLGHACMTLTLFGQFDHLPLACQAVDWHQPQVNKLIRNRLSADTPYLGRLSQQEKQLLMLDESVESVALLRLDALGVLAVGSAYADHFHPQMDSLLINQLSQLVSFCLQRLLERR